MLKMDSKNCKLSVVVCTYNRSRLLSHCIEALTAQSLDRRLYEVMVVNNNSTDDTQQVIDYFAQQYPNIRSIQELQQGLSYARNRGWKEARGGYVAYIDDDARSNPNWCDRILQAFETVTPQPAAVGGEILPLYENSPPKWFSDDFERRTWGSEKGFLKPPAAISGFSGSNMAFRKDLFEKYGGFSTSYGMVGKKLCLGEDSEFFSRIYEFEPLFWYDPEIKVYHHVPSRNMHIAYRMARSFKSGEAVARIDRKKSTSANRTRIAGRLIGLAAAIPFRFLLAQRTHRITDFVKRLELCSYYAGYFLCN